MKGSCMNVTIAGIKDGLELNNSVLIPKLYVRKTYQQKYFEYNQTTFERGLRNVNLSYSLCYPQQWI